MVAVIKSGRSLRKSFFYNENKVADGAASLLEAMNFPVNTEDTTEQLRLNVLERIAGLRPAMTRPAIHISLNFAPGEILPEDKMRQISQEYMEAIGFGEQPYLLYRHRDAAHPHVHIVSLRVRPDGSSIDTFNIGKRLSEPARKILEEKYNLVRSEGHRQGVFQLPPVDASTVTYGQAPTKRAISNVLSKVLDQYKFGSIQELNAVLRLYNVEAERGEPGSRLNTRKGLMYRVIDAEGKGISPPLKASSFAYEATLSGIEKRLLRNDVLRQPAKPAIRVAIDKAFRQADTIHFPALKRELKRSGVDLVLHQSKEGQLYGVTYIDHRSKVVFNGSDLGKNYSARAIVERLTANLQSSEQFIQAFTRRDNQPSNEHSGAASSSAEDFLHQDHAEIRDKAILEMLLQPEYISHYFPAELRKSRNRKKRKHPKL